MGIMKACILSALLWVVLSVGSYGLVSEVQITPQNIATLGYKFTIVPRTDNLGLFKITVETIRPDRSLRYMTPLLVLQDGEKRIATVRLETVKTDKRIEVLSFDVSADYLAKSILEFDISSVVDGHAIPGGTSYWFYLKDFVKP